MRDFVIVNWRETLFNGHLFPQKECLRFETFDELEILESKSFLKSDILMSDDSHFKRHHFLKNEINGEQMSVLLDINNKIAENFFRKKLQIVLLPIFKIRFCTIKMFMGSSCKSSWPKVFKIVKLIDIFQDYKYNVKWTQVFKRSLWHIQYQCTLCLHKK